MHIGLASFSIPSAHSVRLFNIDLSNAHSQPIKVNDFDIITTLGRDDSGRR